MATARKQSRKTKWRSSWRKWFSRAGTLVRKWVHRVLKIAVGKPVRSPAEPAPQAPPHVEPQAQDAASNDSAATKTARSRPRELGKWTTHTAAAMTGGLDFAPLAPPSRDYRVYEPRVLDDDPRLMVVLHGCRQDAKVIAIGTRLNEHADKRGWPVIYPEQKKSANKYNCWNWFDSANMRGHGESALIIAMHDAMRQHYHLDDAPAFLAGMSAGGALASILALRFPERWAAVAIHSGLPFGAADDPFAAMRVMKEGAKNLSAAHTLRVRSPEAPGLPAIILHGSADDVVDRRNAEMLVRQFLGWNGYFGDDAWETAKLPSVDDEHVDTPYGHPYVLRRYQRKGLAPVHECEVIGMGHAWAGGDGSLPFNDKLGPDASALMVEFFSRVAKPQAVAV